MDPLEEIKKRLDIVDFINAHVPLTKAGRNFKAPCPFHSEKTPSFIVSPERQIWHCFGACNEGGDIFKFLMKWDNVSFGEAAKILADQAGVRLSATAYKDKAFEKKQLLFAINQLAADFYGFLLEKHGLGEKARAYLRSRGVSTKTIKHFQMGYSPNSWDSLLKFLRKKGFGEEEIQTSGLAIRSERNSYYDRFRGRLMFPLTDIRGNVLGFGGRILDPDKKEAKYINTPETPVYHKRENLFGLHQARKTIKDHNEVILTEGEFDTILAHQNGYTNTVAIKGSAVTPDHLRTIKRLANKLVFALDMDVAGNEAVRRGILEAEKFDFQMEVLTIEGGKDPADVFTQNPLAFKEYYKNKLTIYEFIINSALSKQDMTTIYGKKAVVDETLPYLHNIFNPILRDHYLKYLADKTEIPLETIKRSASQFQRKQQKKAEQNFRELKKEKRKREELVEEYLVALILQTDKPKALFDQTSQTLAKEDYYQASTYHLVEKAREAYQKSGDEFQKTLPGELPTELVETYDKGYLLELPFNEEMNWDKEIKKIVLSIKKYSLKRQLSNLVEKDQKELVNQSLKALNEVDKALSVL